MADHAQAERDHREGWPDHPEYDAAIGQLRELCRISGYRTDDLSRAEAEAARRAFDGHREAATPEAVPNAAQVMQMTELHPRSLRQENSRIEDLRGAKIPRNAIVPEYRRTERTSDIRARMR